MSALGKQGYFRDELILEVLQFLQENGYLTSGTGVAKHLPTSGAIDGVNQTFTFGTTAGLAGAAFLLFWNGQLMGEPGDYSYTFSNGQGVVVTTFVPKGGANPDTLVAVF